MPPRVCDKLAEAAGVAVQTVYATFGLKAGVVLGLIDLIDEAAGVHELVGQMGDMDTPDQRLALLAAVRRRIRERAGEMVGTLRGAV